MSDGISVIICCYNAQERIVPTLEALIKSEKGCPREVLIVDNNCTDETVSRALAFWPNDSDFPLRVVKESRAGVGYARHKGLESGIYDYVLFCDDDNHLSPNYVNRVYEIFQTNPDVGIVGGCGKLEPVGAKLPSYANDFSSSLAIGPQGPDGINPKKFSLYGAGVAFRRGLYFNLLDANFDLILIGRSGDVLTSGEDSELIMNLRHRGALVYIDSSLTFKHLIPSSRLDMRYLKGLFEGFGRAEPVFQIYHYYSDSTKPYGWFGRSYWTQILFQWIARVYVLFFLINKKELQKCRWIKSREAVKFLREARKSGAYDELRQRVQKNLGVV